MPAVARHTAVRELREETGLTIQPDALVPLSRWTAPVIMSRRFDTWFFLAAAPAGRVQVDRSEIHDHRWASPRQALEDHQAGHIVLAPPTWVTLHHLTRFSGCDAALAAAGAQAPFHYAPRVVKQGPDSCFLYGGDQAYATSASIKRGRGTACGCARMVGNTSALQATDGPLKHLPSPDTPAGLDSKGRNGDRPDSRRRDGSTTLTEKMPRELLP